MKKAIKPLVTIILIAAVAFVGVNLLLSSKTTACFGSKGKPAVDACSFLIKWKSGAEKGEALYRRSRLYAEGSVWDKEQADLESIVSMQGAGLSRERMAYVYVGLAAAYGRKGDEAGALKNAELAVQQGITDPGVFLSLAGAYIEAKQYRSAVALLESAPIPDAEKGHPYYNALAAAYGGGGDYAKAYYALKKGLEIKAPRPVLAATAKQMGLVCFELKRYKEAETYLGYVVRVGGDCPECPLLLTTIRESLGSY